MQRVIVTGRASVDGKGGMKVGLLAGCYFCFKTVDCVLWTAGGVLLSSSHRALRPSVCMQSCAQCDGPHLQ